MFIIQILGVYWSNLAAAFFELMTLFGLYVEYQHFCWRPVNLVAPSQTEVIYGLGWILVQSSQPFIPINVAAQQERDLMETAGMYVVCVIHWKSFAFLSTNRITCKCGISLVPNKLHPIPLDSLSSQRQEILKPGQEPCLRHMCQSSAIGIHQHSSTWTSWRVAMYSS